MSLGRIYLYALSLVVCKDGNSRACVCFCYKDKVWVGKDLGKVKCVQCRKEEERIVFYKDKGC